MRRCGQVGGEAGGAGGGGDVVGGAVGAGVDQVRAGVVGRWFEAKGFDDDSAYVAETVVSELVTNAYKHAAGAGEGIVVRLFSSEGGPVVEVWDRSEQPPVVQPLRLHGTSGRGLAMVEMLAEAWGYNPLASGGKAVFAVLRAVREPG
ncbi:ATP-binding protein [Actinomadura parmotrematis]|uniref:ATP-binding protein n=1 Tax=Actinomadura parmotrematis TaxID=2864039 RepID=A0ABS7FV90_9ACTN|nr:ATP-binding protein [Actinomadura parmotrematis]MBW8484340.1 ATP-binding protein [Actinomadura parmotrematis]